MADERHAHDPAVGRQVEAMAGYGIAVEDIATVLEIDIAQLRRDYEAQLRGAAIKANARVAEGLFRKATGEGREAVTAAIFWLRTRGGWKETTTHEVSGRDGRPIEIEQPDDRKLAMAIMFMLRKADGDAEA